VLASESLKVEIGKIFPVAESCTAHSELLVVLYQLEAAAM
jgi:hypothetical protein